MLFLHYIVEMESMLFFSWNRNNALFSQKRKNALFSLNGKYSMFFLGKGESIVDAHLKLRTLL